LDGSPSEPIILERSHVIILVQLAEPSGTNKYARCTTMLHMYIPRHTMSVWRLYVDPRLDSRELGWGAKAAQEYGRKEHRHNNILRGPLLFICTSMGDQREGPRMACLIGWLVVRARTLAGERWNWAGKATGMCRYVRFWRQQLNTEKQTNRIN